MTIEISPSTEARPGIPKDTKRWPKCPNHGCPLDLAAGTGTMARGKAPCMQSQAIFDYKMDNTAVKTVVDKFGNTSQVPVYNLEGGEIVT